MATPLDDPAHAARGNYQEDQPLEAFDDPALRTVDQLLAHFCRWPALLASERLRPRRVGGLACSVVATARDGAEQREDRQEQGQSERRGMQARVPGLEPQPAMQADAAVQPDQAQERQQVRQSAWPGKGEHVGIAVTQVRQPVQHSGAQHVAGEPERDHDAGCELQHLDRRHAQRAALPQPPEGEAGMEQEGQEQDQLRGGVRQKPMKTARPASMAASENRPSAWLVR